MKAEDPPEPINIRWENMTYTGKNKFFRRSFSWCLTIILFLICKRFKCSLLTSSSHRRDHLFVSQSSQ
jgi:hypothetical protein